MFVSPAPCLAGRREEPEEGGVKGGAATVPLGLPQPRVPPRPLAWDHNAGFIVFHVGSAALRCRDDAAVIVGRA